MDGDNDSLTFDVMVKHTLGDPVDGILREAESIEHLARPFGPPVDPQLADQHLEIVGHVKQAV